MRRKALIVFTALSLLALLLAWRGTVFSPAPPDIEFAISPNPINRMYPYEMRWSAPEATSVNLKMMILDTKTYNAWYPVPDEGPYSGINAYDLGASGTRKALIPDVLRYPAVRYRIEVRYSDGETTALDTETFPLACVPLWFDNSICSTYESYSTSAALQAYEGGFIVWNEQQREFYVLFDYERAGRVGWATYADTWQAGETVTLDRSAPVGMLAPREQFAKLWMSEPEVQALGWALGEAQPYTMQMQFVPDARYAMFDHYVLGLPSGQLTLITGGGPFLKSGPSWGIR